MAKRMDVEHLKMHNLKKERKADCLKIFKLSRARSGQITSFGSIGVSIIHNCPFAALLFSKSLRAASSCQWLTGASVSVRFAGRPGDFGQQLLGPTFANSRPEADETISSSAELKQALCLLSAA